MMRPAWRETFAGLLCFTMAAGLILAITWPWVLHFRGEFLGHWDPPFHAWKLEFMARRILAGDIFLASGNTNMLYPHSGGLYFEALQWPQALFAALFFGGTSLPSELIYHITLVFFWAVSAPCMYFLLRQLDCRCLPASIGAIVFCILPYRISYMVEFQMEMIYALPLFFAFLIRFFRYERILDAVLTAFCWWLFAVTELYEAFFAVLATPFIVLSFLSRKPGKLVSRRFWIAASAAVFVGLALVCVLLLPYARLHAAGSVLRPMNEVRRHSAQLFSYLQPFGRFAPWRLNAVVDEFSLYPTIPVLALFVAGAIRHLTRVFRGCRRWSAVVVALILLAGGVGFLAIGAALQFRFIRPTHPRLDLWTLFSCVFLFASIAYIFVHPAEESPRTTFLKGLVAVSVFFLFLSLGPKLLLGVFPDSGIANQPNYIYAYCYQKILPFLSGFRVVSRFGVYILFFLVCVATVTLNELTNPLRTCARAWQVPTLYVLVLLGVAVESVPKPTWVGHYRTVGLHRRPPAIRRLLENHPIATLAIVPSHTRDIEGMKMFSLIKGDWPYVWAWGGFFPPYAKHLNDKLVAGAAQSVQAELSKFFPPCLLIVDRKAPPFILDAQKALSFPSNLVAWVDGQPTVDYEKAFEPIADKIDSDFRFSIYRLKPLPPAAHVSRIFRSDVARANPVLSCNLSTRSGAHVQAFLNKKSIFEGDASVDGMLRFSVELAQHDLVDFPFNVFSVACTDGSPLAVASFELTTRLGNYRDVCAPYSVTPNHPLK